MKKYITLIALSGLFGFTLSTQGEIIDTLKQGLAPQEVLEIIQNSQNYAYQGTLPVYNGTLVGEWRTLGQKPEIIEIEGESNVAHLKAVEGKTTLVTNVRVPTSEAVLIYFEAKINEAGGVPKIDNKTKEPQKNPDGSIKLKTGLVGINATFFDEADVNAGRKNSYVAKSNKAVVKGQWLPYYQAVKSKDGPAISNIEIQFTAWLYDAEVRNFKVVPLSKQNLTTIEAIPEPKKQNSSSNSGNMTMQQIMQTSQYIPAIWATRPIPKNEKDFYMHYLQEALEMADMQLRKRVPANDMSIEKLRELTNQARERKGLNPVNFTK
jgi:hypothetical protein